MADIVTPEVRSRMMAGIQGKDTKPELAIRKGLHQLGFRFLVHDKRLPGTPDLVLPKWRAAIFVNGCFWHGHDCHLFRWPATREAFWREKIGRNIDNDALATSRLLAAGWRVGTVWECALKGKNRLGFPETMQRLMDWIRSDQNIIDLRGTS